MNNKEAALAAVEAGQLDDSIGELRRALDKRQNDPAYRGKKSTPGRKDVTIHCRGQQPHSPHYYTNSSFTHARPIWCTGTL